MAHSPLQLLQEAESLIARRQTAPAFEVTAGLIGLLRSEYHTRQAVDASYVGDRGFGHFELCERIARALGQVLTDPAFDPQAQPGYPALLGNLSMLHAIAHGTGEGSLDSWMRMSNIQCGGKHTAASLHRLLLLWTPGSRAGFDPLSMYAHAPELVVSQAVATVGGMVSATPEQHLAREAALAFLCTATPTASDYRRPGVSSALFDAWMRCSYAVGRDKDRVKRFLNQVIAAMEVGEDDVVPRPAPADGKPVMVVPLEAFGSGHAMYRCYGPALDACRRHFHLVALSERKGLDATAQRLFDHCHFIDEECTRDGSLRLPAIEALVKSYRPEIVLYPSIGMSLYTLLIANRRLAPLQVMLYGHPSTTWMPAIDAGFAEEQFLGEDDEFSERLITVPRGTWANGLPPGITYPKPRAAREDDPVRIAVPSVAQKWTWPLIECFVEVSRRARRQVEFHLFSGLHNAYLPAARNAVHRFLPQAVVHPFLPYADYLERLRVCSIHASSFPFGGMNSVIDSLVCGLPLVCLKGKRLHARVDEDLVRRVGLPEWLIADSPEAYVDTLLRLIDGPDELALLRDRLRDTRHTQDALFDGGRPEAFADALLALANESRARNAR